MGRRRGPRLGRRKGCLRHCRARAAASTQRQGPSTREFSLRGGFWHDPRHSVAYRTPPADVAGSVLATLFAGGRGSENHFAVGGGWAFKSFQLDFGADFSDGLDTYSASGVYRF